MNWMNNNLRILTRKACEKVALESKLRRGSLYNLSKNLKKVLSLIISMNVVSFTEFEPRFVIKIAEMPSITKKSSNRFRMVFTS